jgi:8-oxo-dGTP pyrophosphatase MutT (NUDIX family)
MDHRFIRPIALCVFRRGDDVLVAEGYDRVKEELFYRPLGGGIEFGEHSEAAVVREIREELGAEIEGVTLLGTLENLFTYQGRHQHEIVQVYQGDLGDQSIYESAELTGREDDGSTFRAVWMPLSEFRCGTPLYPDGLLELLDG